MAMPDRQLEGLFKVFRTDTRLPRPEFHYRKHRLEFPGLTPDEYQALFREHIAREDLQCFSLIEKQRRRRMWYLVAMDTGNIAQYNETDRRFWSFFHHDNVARFLDSGRGWWIKVEQRGGRKAIEPWQ